MPRTVVEVVEVLVTGLLQVRSPQHLIMKCLFPRFDLPRLPRADLRDGAQRNAQTAHRVLQSAAAGFDARHDSANCGIPIGGIVGIS